MRLPLLLLPLLAACPADPEPDPVAKPGELQAGFARVRIPAPLGIGTAGNGPTLPNPSNTPFSQLYPGTTRVYGHPEMKVLVLSRGEGFEAVFMRFDTIGMFAQLRQEIVLAAGERVGRDLDDALMIGATHTHSGPGRILNAGGLYDIIADSFLPQFHERLVDDAASVIEAAYADLRPARLGTTMAYNGDGHSDRRCEEGEDHENGTIPVLAVERDGQVDALLMAYAIHGTGLGPEDLFLSQDVSGAIEHWVEDGFDHPVEVVMFNSWGADMSLGDPQDSPNRPAFRRNGTFDRFDRIGWSVAEDVHAALADATWHDTPELRLETRRVAINRELIGYDDETFTYDYGAIYCADDELASCETPFQNPDLDASCPIALSAAFPAPTQVTVTVGTIADLAVVTWPGEAGTRLGEALMDQMRAADDTVGDVLFLGYTQDYLGYSLLEDDWWYGGYEASGAIWGPRQGDYLLGEIARRYRVFAGEASEPGPDPLVPFDIDPFDPWVVETAVDPGTVEVDLAGPYGPEDELGFVVRGSDPWLGAPLAWLEDAAGDPVLRPGGTRLTSDDAFFDLQLDVDPPYAETPSERAFDWRIRLSTRTSVEGGVTLAVGSYTLVVEIPVDGGDPVQVRSATFEITD